MNWLDCYSAKRTGYNNPAKHHLRSEFQKDYDRLIFSSAFRRLQNKTQVFPLPGSTTFVHNRLTHSLEVASVGRSLGALIGERIAAKVTDEQAKIFYTYQLQSVISAGCLAHDIGNPAFGHSGEKAISNYFTKNAETLIDGQKLKDFFSDKEWADITAFEGNANAIRVLTKHFHGKRDGGYNLTYATLASIMKYPCESVAVSKAQPHTKKFGFFQSEKSLFLDIVKESNMMIDSQEPLVYKRHPFVYLVEAADDICYSIIDIEDAHRIEILSRDQAEGLFVALLEDLRGEDKMDNIKNVIQGISNDNEAIAFLRSVTINELLKACTAVFFKHEDEILEGRFQSTLMDEVNKDAGTLKVIEDISVKKIYNHPSVIKVEMAGYKIMSGLLEIFVPAVLNNDPDNMQKKALRLIPEQFCLDGRSYDRIMSILDYISGMTDDFAMDMYRKFMGIEVAGHGN